MKIEIATVCGLCGGCQRAINLAREVATQQPTVLYREIVHNATVNQNFRESGVPIVDELDTIPAGRAVVIRAHGEPPATFATLREKGLTVVDGTCPRVKAIHDLVRTAEQQGKKVVVVGNYGKVSGQCHPEVAGIQGYATAPILVQDLADVAEKVVGLHGKKLLVVSQTTFGRERFAEIVTAIQAQATAQGAEVEVQDTNCQATKLIQQASLALAKRVDLMIVVGGANSHNTRVLYDLVAAVRPTILLTDIATWREAFKQSGFPVTSQTRIGVTAGASTTREELEKLVSCLRANFAV